MFKSVSYSKGLIRRFKEREEHDLLKIREAITDRI